MELSGKHKKFAEEYLIDMHGTKAYLRAGYKCKEDVARRNASRLLSNPEMKEYIKTLTDERSTRTQISQDRVLQEYARLGLFDPRKLFNADGKPIPINELDDDTAAAIAGLEVYEEFSGNGDDRAFMGYTKKYKIADKLGALDSIARHLGMFIDRKEINGNLVIINGESDLED